jgi:protein phosphatase
MSITYATSTHIGLVRHGNEDAALAQPPLFAVADGMGGALAGDVASGIAIEALADFASRPDAGPSDLTALVTTVNREILDQANSGTGRSGMGTTLTAAIVAADAIDLVHVGDSRAYRLRGGRLEQLTEDHSLVGEMVRKGELTDAEALVHPQRSIITRALGVESEVESDSYHVELEPGDLFLLCSDGLYSMVTADAIAEILTRSSDLEAAAAALVEAANASGGADNVTVVLFSPDGSIASGTPGMVATSEEPGGANAAPLQEKPAASSWLRTWKALLVVGVIAVSLILFFTWLMTQQIYYLGVDDGRVSIYRGLPVELGPLSLSSVYRQSNVELYDLEPFEQQRIMDHELTSLETAEMRLENFSGTLTPDSVDTERNRGSTSTGTVP